jgi:S-adenosyl methyltransferase
VPPPGVDLERPSVARVYDYYLGGTTNWAVDREFGDRVLERFPLLRDIALANRLFLNRVVRYLTKRGIRQFLDIGAGVPTEGNTHQVADDVKRDAGEKPDVRVVYADNEPVAVAHAGMLLDSEGDPARHAVIEADLRVPEALWHKALETELLDPNEPIALLLIAILHVHQPDADGNDIGPESVARFRDLLPKGSYLAISHLTDEGVPAELGGKLAELKRMYDESSSSDVIWRPRADIAALLDDFRLVEPGWTWTPEWRPEETGPNVRTVSFRTPNESVIWAGVGEKVT